jgi:tRNA(Ile2)-agmatinylcytidine synthase
MEKKGLGKGYRCEKCGVIILNPELECKKIVRGIAVKLSLPPPHSQKHLMKPIDRYGKERNGYSYELLPVTITTKIIEPLEFL